MTAWGATTLALYGVGGAALATSLVKLRRRFELSRAKHQVAGRPFPNGAAPGRPLALLRVRRRTASSAPTAHRRTWPTRGRAGLERLSAQYKARFAETIRRTAEAAESISDLQFTDAYRVPFQYSRLLRRHLPSAAFVQSSAGVTVTDLDGNRVLRPQRLLRRQRPRLRFLQGRHRARRGAGARARPGARPLSSPDPREREPPEGDFRARRGVVPYVGNRSGDAGRAACALPHKAVAPGAFLRRLSWLVGRRAAGHRQSGAGARNLHVARHVRGGAPRPAHAARYRLRTGQSRCRRCIRTPRPRAIPRSSTAAAARISTRPPMPRGSRRCAPSAPSATSF